MNSAPVTCPRLGRVISSGECCGIICSTPSRQELGLCLACPVGQRLAMTCPFYIKMHAVPDQGATRPAEAALREVLRFVLPRYKTDRSFGFKFLSVVAQAQFHWHGRPEDLEGAARDAGLTMRKRADALCRGEIMSNVTQIPDPPQLKVLGCFLSQRPPMIARKEVKYFTGGAISSKSVSNDDYLGNGPKFRMKMGDAVVYPTAFFLAYLEAKGVKLIVPPSL